jgi:hypothetical protein
MKHLLLPPPPPTIIPALVILNLILLLLPLPTLSLSLRLASFDSITPSSSVNLEILQYLYLAAQHWNERNEIYLPSTVLLASSTQCSQLNITILPICNNEDNIHVATSRGFKRIFNDGPIHGIVGLSKFDETATLAHLSNAVPEPRPIILSHAATASELSDKIDYPIFARLALNDYDISTTILSLVQQLEFNYVGILYTPARTTTAGALKLLFSDAGIEIEPLSLASDNAFTRIEILEVRLLIVILGHENRTEDEILIRNLAQKVPSLSSPQRLWMFTFSTLNLNDIHFIKDSMVMETFLHQSIWVQPRLVGNTMIQLNNPSSTTTTTTTLSIDSNVCYDNNEIHLNLTTTSQLVLPESMNAYDSVLALGLAACSSEIQSYVINSTDLYNRLMNINFIGVSGQVSFISNTGDRDVSSLHDHTEVTSGVFIQMMLYNDTSHHFDIYGQWNSTTNQFIMITTTIPDFETFRNLLPTEIQIPSIIQSHLSYSVFVGITIQVALMWTICTCYGIWILILFAKDRLQQHRITLGSSPNSNFTSTKPRKDIETSSFYNNNNNQPSVPPVPPNSVASGTNSATDHHHNRKVASPKLLPGYIPLVLISVGMSLEIGALFATLVAEDAQMEYFSSLDIIYPEIGCNAQFPLYFAGSLLVTFALFQRGLNVVISASGARRAQFELRIALLLSCILFFVLFPIWFVLSPFHMIEVIQVTFRDTATVKQTKYILDTSTGGPILFAITLTLYSCIQVMMVRTAYHLKYCRSLDPRENTMLEFIVISRCQVFFASLPVFFALWDTPLGRIGAMELLVIVSWLLCIVFVFIERFVRLNVGKSTLELFFHGSLMKTTAGDSHVAGAGGGGGGDNNNNLQMNNGILLPGGRMLAAIPAQDTSEQQSERQIVEVDSTKEVVHGGQTKTHYGGAEGDGEGEGEGGGVTIYSTS